MEKHIEGNIVDIHHRKIFPGVVSINKEGSILSITKSSGPYKHYILPGFIDAHVHIESSMLTPEEFSKLVIQKGTVAIVNDPHEIANVLGKEGIYFMLENSKNSLINMFFTIPSCVPATTFDFSGGELSPEDIEELVNTGQFVGLSEVMNIPAVIHQHSEMMRKIEIAHNHKIPIDGHAPGLSGKDLLKYINSGISTDHECVDIEEALEKINTGMRIIIREGSAAKNYETLKSLIALYPDKIMFCTDDSHPGDLLVSGHIDKIVKKAIQDGFDFFDVLKIASVNPIQHYNLPVGTLKINDPADFIIVEDLNSFRIRSVYIKGKERYNKDNVNLSQNKKSSSLNCLNKFVRTPILKSDLQKSVSKNQICIGVKNGEIITTKEVFSIAKPLINFESDVKKDVLKIVYLNRYQNIPPQIAYIKGTGLKKGAYATSISHDSHNIVAVGCNDQDIMIAINAVVEEKGGLALADNNKIITLPLPIAGIMTNEKGQKVAQKWNCLIQELHQMGCSLESPFMTLSFMALIVIPELKIGEKGLFEYSKFDFISE